MYCSNSEDATKKILDYLEEHFDILIEEANCFVGLQIEQDVINNTLKIHQRSYLERILKRFNMEDRKALSTPMDINTRLIKSTKKSNNEKKHPYKEAVGSLIYLMIGSQT